MKIITERSRILEASSSWDSQYPPNSCADDKKKIGDVLRSTNLSMATADDLEKIIGNRSWSQPEICSECGAEDIPTVQLGQKPYYDSRTAWICEECLKKAISLIEEVKNGKA